MNGTDGEKSAYRNLRVNLLAAAAYVVVILILCITVWISVSDEFAKGIVTLVLGRFLGYVDAVYNFEFGTTRGSKAKDDAISNLAAASPLAPSIVAERMVEATKPAPTVPVVTPGPATPEGVIPAAEAVQPTDK